MTTPYEKWKYKTVTVQKTLDFIPPPERGLLDMEVLEPAENLVTNKFCEAFLTVVLTGPIIHCETRNCGYLESLQKL